VSNAPGLVIEVKGIPHVGAGNILADFEALLTAMGMSHT
jgi:hypothetical protein